MTTVDWVAAAIALVALIVFIIAVYREDMR